MVNKKPWMQYLETLRRVPDDVILSVATREIKLVSPSSCVCGWAVREAIGRARHLADAAPYTNTLGNLPALFGGNESEWSALYCAFYGEQALEAAFVERVKEAAGVA